MTFGKIIYHEGEEGRFTDEATFIHRTSMYTRMFNQAASLAREVEHLRRENKALRRYKKNARQNYRHLHAAYERQVALVVDLYDRMADLYGEIQEAKQC